MHNRVFLSGLLRTLEAAPEYAGQGRFSAEPHAALKAFGHIYAGWGLSQDFYRARLFETALGLPDLDSFLVTWEESFAASRAANLYAQALTWQEADISANERYGGDLALALSSITARVLLMPSATDLYFRVADNEAELEHLRHGELAVIPSVWGHWAGSPQEIPADREFLAARVRAWLDQYARRRAGRAGQASRGRQADLAGHQVLRWSPGGRPAAPRRQHQDHQQAQRRVRVAAHGEAVSAGHRDGNQVADLRVSRAARRA